MNNIIASFNDFILPFAKNYGLPVHKKRAILREYLQTMILSLVYQEKCSKNLFFVGGTSLRLLRGLDRFSEDLDFDCVDLAAKTTIELMQSVEKKLRAEEIKTVLYHNRTARRDYFELRFPHLLFDLKISRNEDEKLMIKFDFEARWRGQQRELILFNRYGFLVNVVTKSLDQILIEKFAAYLNRRSTQPRDIYDIVWLIANGAQPDFTFAKINKIPAQFLTRASDKFIREKKRLTSFKAKIRPFLLEENKYQQLDFFPQLVSKLEKK